MKTHSQILVGLIASLAASIGIAVVAMSILRGMNAESRRLATVGDLGYKARALQGLTASFKEESVRSDVRQAKAILLSLDNLLKNLSSRAPREQVLIEQLQRSHQELGPLMDQWFASGQTQSALETERREILASQIWMKVQFLTDDTKRLREISQSRMLTAQKNTAAVIVALIVVLALTNGTIYWLSVRRIVRAQRAVRESEARLSGLVNSAMDAVIAVDEAQRVVLFNPAAEKMFGIAAMEALRSSLDGFIPARFREMHRSHVEKFGRTGATGRRMGALGALTGVRANGEEFPIEASISHMEVGGRKLLTVILRDITERKEAEEALRQTQNRLELALQSSGSVPWGWNVVENRLDDWTPEYRQLYGFAPDEPARFETWLQRIHPDDRERLSARTQQILQTPGDDAWSEEFRIQHSQLGERWIGGSGRAYRDETGRVLRMAGVNLDITERKRADVTLRNSREQLRAALKFSDAVKANITEGLYTLDRSTRWIAAVSSPTSTLRAKTCLDGRVTNCGGGTCTMRLITSIRTALHFPPRNVPAWLFSKEAKR
jgi:PAS domain S-box-containing protein